MEAWHGSYAWIRQATRRWRNGRPPTRRSIDAAAAELRAELDKGYYAVVSTGEGHAEQVTSLPLDASLVILRRPIAGG